MTTEKLRSGRRLIIASIMAASALLLAISASALAARFEGEGWAPIESADLNIPRREALQAALSRAVGAATGSLLPARVFVEKSDTIESKILHDPKKYIENFTVIAESKDELRYHLVAQVAVKLDVLRADLVSMGLLLPESKIPKWIVIIPDRIGEGMWRSRWIEGGGGPSSSEAAIEDIIRGYGFRVTVISPQGKRLPEVDKKALFDFVEKADPKTSVAPAGIIAYARAQQASYLLLGKGAVVENEGLNGPPFMLGSADLKLIAVEASSGKIIGSLTRRASLESFGTVGLDTRVLRMAIRHSRDELTKTLDSVNPSGSAAGFPTVSILLTQVNSFRQYTAIRQYLEQSVQGVLSVDIRKLAPGQVLIEVRYAGDADKLIAELTKHEFDNLTIKSEGSEGGVYKLSVK